MYAIDTDSSDKVAVDLTPYPNTRAWVTQFPGKASNLIFVMHSRRDATRFDLYSIDLITRASIAKRRRRPLSSMTIRASNFNCSI